MCTASASSRWLRPSRLASCSRITNVGRVVPASARRASKDSLSALAVSASFLPILSSIAEMISILTVSPQTEQ